MDGGNGTLVANEFFITGNATSNGGDNGLTTAPVPNQIFVGVHPTPDPLAYLPVPSVPPNGTDTMTNIGAGNKQYVLTPGRHTNLPTFSSGDIVILKQASANDAGGIYYIDGGGFKSTGATITMDPTTNGGAMIYNKPASSANSEKIQVTDNSAGTVNMKPLTQGPYMGMMLWQERSSTVPILVEGNGNFNIKGSFYAASGLLNVNGNGGTFAKDDGTIVQGSAVGSQFIVKDMSLGGNGNIFLQYASAPSVPQRILCLVE